MTEFGAAAQPSSALRASRTGSGPYGRVGSGGRGVLSPMLRVASKVTADQVASRHSAASHIEVQETGTMCSTFPDSKETRICAMLSCARSVGVPNATVCSHIAPYPTAVTATAPATARRYGFTRIRKTASTVTPTASSQNGTTLGGKMVKVSSGQIRHR